MKGKWNFKRNKPLRYLRGEKVKFQKRLKNTENIFVCQGVLLQKNRTLARRVGVLSSVTSHTPLLIATNG